jgi:hypothetical protein
MALGPFTILVANLFPSQNRQAKKKGLPFLGRQPLVLQLLTANFGGRKAQPLRLETITRQNA